MYASLYALAVRPFTLNRFSLGAGVLPGAVLLPVEPLARIAAAIWPLDDSIAMLLVIPVLSLVDLPAVWPLEDALAVHLVVFPFAHVVAPISPSIGANALDVVISELTLVSRVVGPSESTLFSVLVACDVGSLIARAIRPRLHSHSMLLICDPVPFV